MNILQNLSINELTEKLAELRFHMDEIEAGFKETMEPLKNEKTLLDDAIIHKLIGEGMHSTPEASNGDYFTRSHSTTYKVVDEAKARLWALKNDAIAIDKARINAILRRTPASQIPPCFKADDKNTLVIVRAYTDPALPDSAPLAAAPAPKPAKTAAKAKSPAAARGELVESVALKPTKHAATKKLQKN